MRNQTRDAEATVIRQLLADIPFTEAIELGCGTGKNTEWLAARAVHLTAVDFSAGMMVRAREKLTEHTIRFQQADITQEWDFVTAPVDLITCSLILEHIPELDFVFRQVQRALRPAGVFYVGELHPFRQYLGSKARFDTGADYVLELDCFTHHVSDFVETARANGLQCVALREWFDDNDRTTVPRILAMLFQRNTA